MNTFGKLWSRAGQEFARVVRSSFARQAGGLGFSTVMVQALWAAAFVALDRLYTQEEIGIFSVFMAYALTLIAFSLLGYPLAIPKTEDDPLRALIVGLLSLGLVVGAAVGAVFFVLGYGFAWALGVTTFLGAVVQLCEQVNLRDQRIRPIVWSRILTRLLFFGAILIEPFRSGGAESIVTTHVLSIGLVALFYAPIALWPHVRKYRSSLSQICSVFREHWRFPIFVAPARVFNLLAYQFPVILLDAYFGAVMAAQYSLTIRFCATPVNVLSGAVGQAYHARLAEVVREKKRGFYPHFKRLCFWLVASGALAGGLIFLLFPTLITWLLGPEWQKAGEMARIMAPLYAMMLFVSGVGTTLLVFQGERFLFLSQFAYLFISIASFGFAIYFDEVMLGVALFTGLAVLRYATIFSRVWWLSKRHLTEAPS